MTVITWENISDLSNCSLFLMIVVIRRSVSKVLSFTTKFFHDFNGKECYFCQNSFRIQCYVISNDSIWLMTQLGRNASRVYHICVFKIKFPDFDLRNEVQQFPLFLHHGGNENPRNNLKFFLNNSFQELSLSLFLSLSLCRLV